MSQSKVRQLHLLTNSTVKNFLQITRRGSRTNLEEYYRRVHLHCDKVAPF
jgi:hypothetical protein